MIISFQLSMPNNNAWNGKWTGSGQPYFIIRKFKKSETIFLNGKNEENYYYDFQDGWGASVKVEIIDAKESKLRSKASKGFCGYDWMVNEIIAENRIVPREERIARNKEKEFIDKLEMIGFEIFDSNSFRASIGNYEVAYVTKGLNAGCLSLVSNEDKHKKRTSNFNDIIKFIKLVTGEIF